MSGRLDKRSRKSEFHPVKLTVVGFRNDADLPDHAAIPERAHEIHEEFLELVETHSLTHREVSFYADKLCITPKYLSKMVLQASGRSVKNWIFTRIMLEAKVLLMDRSRSIQEISEMLGFPNQSSFGSFFRKMKGMSPTAYRSRKTISATL